VKFMVWAGKSLSVTVNPGAPGKWPKEHVRRDVYAVVTRAEMCWSSWRMTRGD
jgi:hypothetical protein